MFNNESIRIDVWLRFIVLFGSLLLDGESHLIADELNDEAKSPVDESLSLRRVQLFPSGQGVFEYQGTSILNSTLALNLTSSEMDDVLKSLTLKGFDRAEFHFEGDGDASSANTIDLGFDRSSTIAEMLQGMRGKNLKVLHAGEVVEGSIIAVELRSTMEQGETTDREIISLMTNGVIRQFEVAKVTQFSFADPDVQSRFQNALVRVADRQPMRQRATLRIENREVNDGAIVFQHQVSPWKLAYRIAKIGDAYELIASAVIDNTSGRDWVDVTLDLVVDQPLGFHTPLGVVQHPLQYSLDLPKPFSSAPPSIRAGVRRDNAVILVDRFAPNQSSGGDSSDPMGTMTEGKAIGMGGMGPIRSARAFEDSDVIARSIEYDHKTPQVSPKFDVSLAKVDSNTIRRGPRVKVTIPNLTIKSGRSSSQFLPTIGAKVKPKQIYVPSVNEYHPLAAFELLLPDGSQLLGGPGTVWGNDGYEGDIMVPHLLGSQPQLVGYALNSSIDITLSESVRQLPPIWRLIDEGRIEMTKLEEKTKVYAIANKDNKEHRVVIEHRYEKAGREIQSSIQPVERLSSENRYETLRFEVQVGPNGTQRLEIIEATKSLANLDPKTIEKVTIEAYLNSVNLPGDVAARLGSWLESEIASRKRIEERTRLNGERESVLKELHRIQAWLNTLHREDEIYQRYMKKLDDLENRLEIVEAKLAS